MLKSTFYKGGTVVVSAVTFAFAGFAGQALASTGTIDTTGPDSYNSISMETNNTCEVTNNNNVNVSNNVRQNATTGDVEVSGNTNAGGEWNAGWNDWSPVTWQNHGYTYDQWHAAFMAYMSANEGNMRAHWGHMSGGSATSGDATNNNSTSTNIHISNGAAGGAGSACAGSDADNDGSIDTTGPDSHNGVVMSANNSSKTKNNNNVGVNGKTSQGASTGNSSVKGNTNGGGAGSGAAGNGNNTGSNVDVNNGGPQDPGHGAGTPGNTGTISNTGPDSWNQVVFQSTNQTTVTNNNNVGVKSWVSQNATSGDTTVSHNTNAGAAGSGSAGNNNGTANGVGIQN